jgi:hypothetical protein
LESVIDEALRRATGRDFDRLGTLRPPGGEELLRENLVELSRQVSGLSAISQAHAGSTEENTRAVIENSVAHASGAGQGIKTAGRTLASVSGTGLSPLVRALGSLFGGKQHEEPPVLRRYIAPPPIRFDAASVPGGFAPVSYGQGGSPRVRATEEAGDIRQSLFAPQVTIQVSAMDSRSFLDRSEDIARAVREAMLNMHPVNDVVNDL